MTDEEIRADLTTILKSEDPRSMRNKARKLEAEILRKIMNENSNQYEAAAIISKRYPETDLMWCCSPLCETHLKIEKRDDKRHPVAFKCGPCPLSQYQKSSCNHVDSLYRKWAKSKNKELSISIINQMIQVIEGSLKREDDDDDRRSEDPGRKTARR